MFTTANTNITSAEFTPAGFMPDELTYLCHNGINVYEIYVDNVLYGYWGKRKIYNIDHSHLKDKKEYYTNLISSQGFEVNKLNIIDIYNQNQIDEIFFIDQKNRLCSYNVKLNNFVPQIVINEPTVDYIIGNPIYNNYSQNKSLKYNIYTLHSLNNKSIVKLTYYEKQHEIENERPKTIELLRSNASIDAIFMRANHIITIQIKPVPIINIYKLEYVLQDNYKFDIKLLPLSISVQNNSHKEYKESINFNTQKIELVWSEEFNYHQINIYIGYKLVSYYFKLKQDDDLLAYIDI